MPQDNQPKNLTKHLITLAAVPVIAAAVIVAAIWAINILKPQPLAGEMFGKKIKQSEFNQVYKYNRLQALVRYGKVFESIEPLMDFDSEAWDQLMLLKEAQRQKIKIADRDVIDAVAAYPYFFRNGKFDSLLYRDIIRNSLKAEPKEFEDSIRQSLMVQRLREQITAGVSIDDKELWKEFKKRRDTVQLQYVLIDLKDFLQEPAFSEEELKTYFNAHQEEFESGESVQVQYVWMPFPPDGGVQKQVETKFKGRAIIDKHTKGKLLFKDAAAQLKFEMKETGFFTRDEPPLDTGIDWNSERLSAVFRMKNGEISLPLEQKDGYSVIKMIDKKPLRTLTFEETKDKIIAKLRTQKAQEAAMAKAVESLQQITAKMQTGVDFKTAATESGLTLQESGPARREKIVKKILLEDESVDALAKLEAGASAVINADNGALIVFVAKSDPVTEKDFAKISATFRKSMTSEEKNKVFDRFVKDLRRKANMRKY